VGVRKAIGAGRRQLFGQFLLESVLLNAVGIALAFTLVQLSLPFFRQLTGLALSLTLWSEWQFWAALAGLFVVGTLLSGVYPALVLSAYQPIAVLKGKIIARAGGISLRKSLVVLQFVASVTLLAGTFTIFRQMTYMRNQSLGVDIDQVLVVKAPQLVGDSAMLADQWSRFKTQLQGVATVRSVTASNALPSKGYGGYYNNMSVEGITPEKTVDGKPKAIGEARVDVDFLQLFGLRLAAGRGFSKDLSSDLRSVVLNEAAAKQLGFARPAQALGHVIKGRNQPPLTIIGVLKNYHHDYLKQGYAPAIYRLDPTRTNFFSVKIAGGPDPATRIRETLAAVEKQWKAVYPGNPFEYFFLDDAFNQQYEADRQLASTVGLFAFLAIGVACLGLFGLVSFATTQRTKEIGVRKILGAHTWHILVLLSKDFMGLILVANLIAWPLAYWGMSAWLENYAFKIPITPLLFVLPTLAVLGVAVLTIVLHTRKAARANPVESLRYE
jgi:putative ABC transport system permease protein